MTTFTATAIALLIATASACVYPRGQTVYDRAVQQPLIWQEAFREHIEVNRVELSEKCVDAALESPVAVYESREDLRDACGSTSEGLLGCARGKAGRAGGIVLLWAQVSWATVLHEQMHLALFCEGIASPSPGDEHHNRQEFATLVGKEKYRTDIKVTQFAGLSDPTAFLPAEQTATDTE